MWQLGAMHLKDDVLAAAELVIGNLSEDGYLLASDEELLAVADPLVSGAAQTEAMVWRRARRRFCGRSPRRPQHPQAGRTLQAEHAAERPEAAEQTGDSVARTVRT